MDDLGREETTDSADGYSSGGYDCNPYSEDSKTSDASCRPRRDDRTDDISSDAWETNVYYGGVDDDSKFYARSSPSRDGDRHRPIEIIDDAAPMIDLVDDGLEENNNDPNNNMDSIETDAPRQTSAFFSSPTSVRPRESAFFSSVGRADSPQPGCSKDSQPPRASDSCDVESPDTDAIYEKSGQIMNLVRKIDRSSVIDALYSNHGVPVNEIKLWDLLPEDQRRRYLGVTFSDDDESSDSSDVGRERDSRLPPIFVLGNSQKKTSNGTGVSGKRAPDVDICTVESKKSSSNADPTIVEPTNTSVAKKSSSTPDSAPNLGAIPKVRDAPSRKYKLPRRNNFSESRSTENPHDPTIMTFANGRSGYGEADPNSRIKSNDWQIGAVVSPPLAVRAVTTVPFNPSMTVRPAILKYPITKPILANVRMPAVGEAKQVRENARTATWRASTAPTQKLGGQREGYREIARFAPAGTNVKARLQNQDDSEVVERTLPEKSVGRAKSSVNLAPARLIVPAVQNPPRTVIIEEPSVNLAPVRLIVPAVENPPPPVIIEEPAEAAGPAGPAIPTDDHRPPIDPTLNHEQPIQPQPQTTLPVPKQVAKKKICMEMYYRLRNIFPNIDREYIKQLCPPEWGSGDQEAQLAPLAEHLLVYQATIPPERLIPSENPADIGIRYVNDVDEICENLVSIFPDADPHYLRDFAKKNVGNTEQLKNFVDSGLVNHDYPTRDEYMARLKITEQQRQYTTGFNVKHFLSIIPDPAKHFMDPQRQCKHQTVALEFLKSHYKKNRVMTISTMYARFNYNLSLAADCLESVGDEMKSKRLIDEMPTEDIKLLQEIAFVKHRAEIENYLKNVKETETREFDNLKAMNQLLECECCYDSECVPSKCSTCDNGHIFCNNCVVTGTMSKLGEGETRIHCFVGCGSDFRLSVLQKVLAPTVFSKLVKDRQAAEVLAAGVEGLVSCPFCPFASIPPEGDKIFKCLNPECTKESCRLCQKPSHVPFKCEDGPEATSARLFVEEKMTEALARTCYKCHKKYIKTDGCNKITCACGALMCYLCDAPVRGYDHFAAQGANAANSCPLWSDPARLDAIAVRTVGEQALAQIQNRDPNIKIDTNYLLPNIPQATAGPHRDIANADQLPQRAQRVLGLQPR